MHQQPRATEHPLALNKASRSGQRFGVSGWTVSSMEGLRLAPTGDGHRSVRKRKCKPTNTLLGTFPAQYGTRHFSVYERVGLPHGYHGQLISLQFEVPHLVGASPNRVPGRVHFGYPFVAFHRSEEHTSELQSPMYL